MNWSVTTPPTGTVLTWDQLKAHLHAPVSQQALVMDYLASATAYAETMLECALLPQTITVNVDRRDVQHEHDLGYHTHTGKQEIILPRSPVIQITSVKDGAGADVQYDRYRVGNTDRVEVSNALRPLYPLTIVYRAGFNTVPADIANAIRVHTATLFMVREDGSNLSFNAVHKIDDFYRWRKFGSGVA